MSRDPSSRVRDVVRAAVESAVNDAIDGTLLARYRELGDKLIATGLATQSELVALFAIGMQIMLAISSGRMPGSAIDVAYLERVRQAIRACRRQVEAVN